MANSDLTLKEQLQEALLQELQARGLSPTDLDPVMVDRLFTNLHKGIYREVAELVERQKKLPTLLAKLKDEADEYFLRLSLNLRVQHFIMLISVLTLIITGLPLKFHDAPISHFIIQLFGGISGSAFIHRLGATALIFVGSYHVLYTIFTRTGRRDFMLLIPNKRDLLDYRQQIKYFLGKSDQKAQFGRFSYIEKFDYWAVYWGMVIMIGSGALLWFEGIALTVMPKFVLDIAKEAHSDEALLATLAIIIWHFYNVHFNPHKFPMSKTWITGRISKEEMIEEHALEYAAIIKQREPHQKSEGSPPEERV